LLCNRISISFMEPAGVEAAQQPWPVSKLLSLRRQLTATNVELNFSKLPLHIDVVLRPLRVPCSGRFDMARVLWIFWTALLTVLLAQVRAANFSCCSGQVACGGAKNDPVVCSVLADVFADLGGRSWTNNTGWAAAANGIPTDLCTFYSSPVRSVGAAAIWRWRSWRSGALEL